MMGLKNTLFRACPNLDPIQLSQEIDHVTGEFSANCAEATAQSATDPVMGRGHGDIDDASSGIVSLPSDPAIIHALKLHIPKNGRNRQKFLVLAGSWRDKDCKKEGEA